LGEVPLESEDRGVVKMHPLDILRQGGDEVNQMHLILLTGVPRSQENASP